MCSSDLHIDTFGVGPCFRKNFRIRQVVVHDHVRAPYELETPKRHQSGIAGTRSDEVHGAEDGVIISLITGSHEFRRMR